MTDNSDDKTYPPGKKQTALDFCYHGGMYRDVWLIGKSQVAITDALEAGKVAGGGIFVHYGEISEKSAQVYVDVEVANQGHRTAQPTVEARIKDHTGKVVATMKRKISIVQGGCTTAKLGTTLKQARLWSPEQPYLYRVEISVKQGKQCADGGMVKIGIRRAEFKGKDGFWLNSWWVATGTRILPTWAMPCPTVSSGGMPSGCAMPA